MLYPLFAMVLLTLTVGILALKARYASVKNRELELGYFRDMQASIGKAVPERVQITSRCYNNQFEIPVLFYAAGICAIAMSVETWLTILTAWLFVGTRVVHAWIHLTYNHVLHRMRAFWAGILFVLVLWGELFTAKLFSSIPL
ncbi:MAG: MAPEG family protein [Pseudohongiellaceae bacterium]